MTGLFMRRSERPDNVRISMDEWNVRYAWYRPSSVMDGIFTALTLHMLMAEAETCGIELACHFEAINEGLLCAEPSGAYLTAQGQVFALMKHHIGGRICHCEPKAFVTQKDGVYTLTAVNESYDQCRKVQIACGSRILSTKLLGSQSVIPPSFFEEEALCVEKCADGYGCTMPPHSVMMITIAG